MTRRCLTYHAISRSDTENASPNHRGISPVAEGREQLPHDCGESIQPTGSTSHEVTRPAAESTSPDQHDDPAIFEGPEAREGCVDVSPTIPTPQETGDQQRGEYRCPVCARPNAGPKKGRRWFSQAAGLIDHA